MRAGTKGRRQALMFMITNSGFDRKTVCWDYHKQADRVLNGVLEDDSLFRVRLFGWTKAMTGAMRRYGRRQTR